MTFIHLICEYRQNSCFLNSLLINIHMPPLIHSNPDLKENLLSFCKENISALSSEVVHDHLIFLLLPNKTEKEQNIGSYSVTQLMKDNDLKTLSLKIVQIWTRCLGFKFERRKKLCG